ncbi:MAG: hypothetical protein RI973_298 [Bacteroidota bacterium]
MAILLQGGIAMAQLPVEVFGGHEKTTVDIMFFKFFRDSRGENTRWLFFNRNRASVDHRMTESSYLPQFGFTEAISYNHKQLKGFAPVLAGQVLSRGVYPKAGIQYAHLRKNLTIFTWLVCETLEDPFVDYSLLFRYTPRLTEKANLFTQVESVNAFPSASGGHFSFTQRLRLGLQLRAFQFGAGADFNQAGNGTPAKTSNIGGFARYEF